MRFLVVVLGLLLVVAVFFPRAEGNQESVSPGLKPFNLATIEYVELYCAAKWNDNGVCTPIHTYFFNTYDAIAPDTMMVTVKGQCPMPELMSNAEHKAGLITTRFKHYTDDWLKVKISVTRFTDDDVIENEYMFN